MLLYDSPHEQSISCPRVDPRVSEAHWGYTYFHEYVITILCHKGYAGAQCKVQPPPPTLMVLRNLWAAPKLLIQSNYLGTYQAIGVFPDMIDLASGGIWS